MKRYAPHLATTILLVVSAIALHREHVLGYAAAAAVILGALFSRFGRNAGLRAGVLLLALDAVIVPIYGRAQMISLDVSFALLALIIVSVRFRLKQGRWPHETHRGNLD